MKSIILAASGVFGLLILMAAAGAMHRAAEPPPGREKLTELMNAGNYKDAYDGFRALALDPKDAPQFVSGDLINAIQCLIQLGRVNEIDEFREAVIAVHSENWRLLEAAAQSYLSGAQNDGFIVAGKFERGAYREGGRHVSSRDRDRVRALQLLVKGMDLARRDPNRQEAGRYFLTLATTLNAVGEAWRLQSLTDLDTLPDYDPQVYRIWMRDNAGAPVQPDGTPVYYQTPREFAEAKNDGERWRWALSQAVEADQGQLNATRMIFADFLVSQFGTQTLAEFPVPYGADEDGDEAEAETSVWDVKSLRDDETIARLATGPKRWTLPDEFNPIKIYLKVADEPRTGQGEDALGRLAGLFENRQQFDRAVEYLRRSLASYGDRDKGKSQQLSQILGNWGQFLPVMSQPAGKGATVDFQFRNGRRVQFEAHEILIDKLLDDVTKYIASRPAQVDWEQTDVSQLGHRLVERNQRQYQGREVAKWTQDLDPPDGHFSKSLAITTPLQKAGAYLLTATMDGGNVSHIVLWLDDTIIVKKPVDGKAFYFIADARTGQPIPNADVRLFGWRMVQVEGKNEFRMETKTFDVKADAEGQVSVPLEQMQDNRRGGYQWIVTARTNEGRLAYLGFSPVWGARRYDEVYNQVKVQTITDRPVYRPGQPVRFKFWVGQAKYDQGPASRFAHKKYTVEGRNPKGDIFFTKEFETDDFGGFDGEFELASDATLGVYQLIIPGTGGGNFRVEEYKKPEFEVKVEGPKAPIMLGEKITATIEAKYLFGAPVSEAKLKYKVTRSTVSERWYPVGPWDWLFGSGYWWFAVDSSWYPGWSSWGVARPIAWWWSRPQAPPEVVAEAEVAIRPDGTFPVEIDTEAAKKIHSNTDHRYEITAEVTDQSRRTITGGGTVLVARQPFKVYTWVDRGHYRAGDTIEASIRAQTVDHKPVAGKGTLKLLKITYGADEKPVETPVESWDVTLNAEGQVQQTVKAAAPGQYRLAATIDDGQGHKIEGGYLLTILGQGYDGASFRFNDLEIIPDRKEYHPGETLRLLINTNRVNSTVLLFVRPTNGVYLPPKVLHLKGKSQVEEVGIVEKDMPNLFIEALTVSDGKVHSEAREIAIPPVSKVVNVQVEPSAATYKPGEKAKVKLKLTAEDGKPYVGSTVLTVYDKAVEYISGGSNVADIKELFWKWKRSHYPAMESSADRSSFNVIRPGHPAMQPLGIFGGLIPPRVTTFNGAAATPRRRQLFQRGMMGGYGGMRSASGITMSGERDALMAAAPMARAEGMADMAAAPAEKAMQGPGGPDGEGGEGGLPGGMEPVIRTNFADTAYWAAAITAGADGVAEVEFPLPESLTTWKLRSWTLGQGSRVGQGEAEIITTKDLLVRLQAPRFFVQKDEVVLSANVHNKLKTKKSVQVVLESEGSVLQFLDDSSRTVEIDAGGEHRVDWRVKVAHEGDAVIRMKAITDEESDAAQMTFPALVHGMLKLDAIAGALRPDQEKAELSLRVPADRRPEQSRIEIRYSPTLAGALVDALPYLADYPYGCTEQTLNRFLPTVITQKILINLGVDLAAIRDKRTNLNAQELGDPKERAKQWMRYQHNPVFDQAEVTKMANAGIQRLADMQLSDGGWGWFSGYGEYASPHTTALVVHGLQIARQNDVLLPEGILDRGIGWLTTYQARQVSLLENDLSKVKPSKPAADDQDALVFMVLADAGLRNDAMLTYLDRDRTKLSVYAKAMFGLGLEKLGEKEKLGAVLQNLSQYVVQDNENQTAYLKLPNEGYSWYWYGSEVETDAFYLKLLARTDPKGELASRLTKYVLNNRRHGYYWNSTRDTAFCIEALADYLRASGEDRPDMTVQVSVDGRTKKDVKIKPSDLFTFDNTLVLQGNEVETGTRNVSIVKQGKGPLYYNAYLTNFTLEDPITRAGLEIKVDRKVYRLIRDDKTVDVSGDRGQAVGQKVERYRRELLAEGATLKSGELVEIELEIESKNDYEYLLFEDYKAAGFEPVEVRSGYNGNDLNAYVEFRDDRVAFFSRSLTRGKHSVSYRLRAEIPGAFHALPARAQAMYAPELKGNSDEIQLKIVD